MNILKSKIVQAILGVLLLAVIIFVVLNASYFLEASFFFIHKPVVTQTQQAVLNGESKGAPNNLQIPSLGIMAPLIEPTITEGKNANLEDDFQRALINGVVHYPGTAQVGHLGNAYFFGHSSDFAFSKGKFKTVFALLPNIEIGAEILVSDNDGNVFHYIVTDSHVINKDDMSVLDQHGNAEKILSLQTSYPVGTALKRWIVVSKLK